MDAFNAVMGVDDGHGGAMIAVMTTIAFALSGGSSYGTSDVTDIAIEQMILNLARGDSSCLVGGRNAIRSIFIITKR